MKGEAHVLGEKRIVLKKKGVVVLRSSFQNCQAKEKGTLVNLTIFASMLTELFLKFLPKSCRWVGMGLLMGQFPPSLVPQSSVCFIHMVYMMQKKKVIFLYHRG